MEGDGIRAFARLRHWHNGSSGMAITARTQLIMNPSIPKGEESIEEAIDRWKEQIRAVEQMGEQYKLPDAFKRTALRSMMVGRGKGHCDQTEECTTGIDELTANCYAYANRRRLEAKKISNDMDLGEVNGEEGGGEEEWQ